MYLTTFGPPNSPPMALLRRINRIKIATQASEQNSVTENARLKLEWMKIWLIQR